MIVYIWGGVGWIFIPLKIWTIVWHFDKTAIFVAFILFILRTGYCNFLQTSNPPKSLITSPHHHSAFQL